ncbi:hypothetical protein RND81_14G108400 [Saponaria officinalis]|uniref:SWIM-type domain-containing protein n=1 Tax=Saponaria officinalis TaxID=3572 RepID=A0AAW1GUV1_SAPOF
MTSNVIPSTPLAQTASVEKHTPPILLSYSPKGSQQWIRKVEEEFTPRVGMEFDTLEDGIQFYRIYAIAYRYDIIKSSQRKRVTTIRRFGCTAMIKLMFQLGKYVICQFREGHKHPLVLEVANGYENVGASLLDFKNFQREVKLFIGDADAEMFINNLEKLGRNLSRVFWTDAHGKSAYLVFGDGVSFDQTYGTNKYCMVFTPFTGIDNHKKSITFSCALLSNKDEESFVWVFEKFMDAMGRKEPQMIITDQDHAIKNAIPTVFKTARHHFFLWHIMNKVADKIDIITRKETDFLSRLNAVVWNQDLEPTEFENKWNGVITEFGLDDSRWLSMMFDIKEYWIPAYFRDLHMGNIMSTTQRSKSENSFFKKFENHYGTLVEFWHTHKRLEMESNNSVLKAITALSLESHALTVYTYKVFYEIQEEIKSSMCGCVIVGYSRSASLEMTAIEDSHRNKTFAVQYNALTSDVLCTCKLFERRGLICRHIFLVFSNKLLKTIPEKYILTRWSKNALRGPIYDLNGNIIENYDAANESQLEMSK